MPPPPQPPYQCPTSSLVLNAFAHISSPPPPLPTGTRFSSRSITAGKMFTREEQEAIAAVVERHNLLVFSDEVYEVSYMFQVA